MRSGFLLPLSEKVTSQTCFTCRIRTAPQLLRNVLLNYDVRRNAFRLDGAPRGREVTRSGQRQRSTFAAKRDQRLHRAFAEGPRANDRCAVVVLQGAGDEAEPPLINAITGFPSLISLPARALKI